MENASLLPFVSPEGRTGDRRPRRDVPDPSQARDKARCDRRAQQADAACRGWRARRAMRAVLEAWDAYTRGVRLRLPCPAAERTSVLPSRQAGKLVILR